MFRGCTCTLTPSRHSLQNPGKYNGYISVTAHQSLVVHEAPSGHILFYFDYYRYTQLRMAPCAISRISKCRRVAALEFHWEIHTTNTPLHLTFVSRATWPSFLRRALLIVTVDLHFQFFEGLFLVSLGLQSKS
jgi:hypothetical protein